MSIGGLLNKERIPIAIGLIAGAAYVYCGYDRVGEVNFDRNAALVAVGTVGAMICLFLLFEVTAPNAYLGALQSESGSLKAGLIWGFFLGGIAVIQLFQGLPKPEAWLLHTWSDQKNCRTPTTPMILEKGTREGSIIFRTGQESFPLNIEEGTADKVSTDQGMFTKLPDGSMIYDQMEGKKFTRCD